MFKNILLKILIIFFLLISFTIIKTNKLIAQEIIEEGQSKKKLENYWDKHFKVDLATSLSQVLGTKNYRAYSYFSLSFKEELKWINFNFEALAFRRDYQYSLKVNVQNQNQFDTSIQALGNELEYKKVYDLYKSGMGPKPADPDPSKILNANEICSKYQNTTTPFSDFKDINSLSQEANLIALCGNRKLSFEYPAYDISIRNTDVLFREANVVLKLGEKAQLLLGYHTLVWGQLDFYSPIDFYLPLRIGTAGLGLVKADNRNPQKMALLSIFPKPWMELQLYFFPDTGIDSYLLNRIISTSAESSEYNIYKNTKTLSGKDFFRYAGRALFYLDKATIGFTWYQGFYQFSSYDNTTIIKDTKYDKEIYKVTNEPDLQSIILYGIEFAYPIGKWILKNDFAYTSVSTSFGNFDITSFNNQLLGFLPKDKLFDKRQTFLNWILNSNNGKYLFSENYINDSIGVDANLDRWLINLSLNIFYFSRSSKANHGLSLAYDALPDDQKEKLANKTDFAPIPAFNIAYYLNSKKTDLVGVGGGSLVVGAGIFAYYGAEFFESLRFGISLEYFTLYSNAIFQVPGYDLDRVDALSLRVTFQYSL